MHHEAYLGVQWALSMISGPVTRVLDLGGADHNGTVHDLLPEGAVIDVLDAVDGPGVTIVADATVWEPEAAYDLVICTEVFEHCENWPAIVATAHKALRESGYFIATCASTGRRPHGAWGALDPGPDEWYANIEPQTLRHVLSATGFSEVDVQYRLVPGDAYSWSRK